VEPNERPNTFDPDFDLPPTRPARYSLESIEANQRLVCNPFLGCFALVVIYALIRTGLRWHNLTSFLTAIGLLFVPFLLFQYHCLDCGATGWLIRSRRHVCSAVVARLQNEGVRRPRGPSIPIQTTAWFCLMGIVFLMAMIVMMLVEQAPRR